MSGTYPNQRAHFGTLGAFVAHNLFAGEKEIVTGQAKVAGGVAFAQFEVVAITAAGVVAKLNPAATDGTQVAKAVLAQPIPATSVAGDVAPVYYSAFFNHDALVWPAALTDLDARKAAVLGTEIKVGRLLGSDQY